MMVNQISHIQITVITVELIIVNALQHLMGIQPLPFLLELLWVLSFSGYGLPKLLAHSAYPLSNLLPLSALLRV